jgi:DeoR family transcriptional regulator, fructose operon transcriptional repressor
MDWKGRRTRILSSVEVKGTIKVVELARQLEVTEMTIRRDLIELEREGLVKRVHGGVISARGRSYEPTMLMRNTIHSEEKKRIGKRAAAMVNEGDCIGLDVGTTTIEVARNLVGKRNLTIITPSLVIANLMANQPDIRLVLPGGIIRPGEVSMVGDLTLRAFDIFHMDLLFLGMGGIDSKAGMTEYNWEDTLVKQAMLKAAKEVVIVLDASKFERIATINVAPITAVNTMVTNQAPPPPLSEELEKAGVKVIIAE